MSYSPCRPALLCALFSAALLACSGGKGGSRDPDPTPEVTPDVTADATPSPSPTPPVMDPGSPVGADGAIVADDAGASVAIPAGALEEEVAITVEAVEEAEMLPESDDLRGPAYDFGPDGTQFDTPVTITLPLTGIPGDGKRLVLSWLDESRGEWVDLPDSRVGFGEISATVDHFTIFAAREADGTAGDGSFRNVDLDGAALDRFDEASGFSFWVTQAGRLTLRGEKAGSDSGSYRFANWSARGDLAGSFPIVDGRFEVELLVPGGQNEIQVSAGNHSIWLSVARSCDTCGEQVELLNVALTPGTRLSEDVTGAEWEVDATRVQLSGETLPAGTGFLRRLLHGGIESFEVTPGMPHGTFDFALRLHPGENHLMLLSPAGDVHFLRVQVDAAAPTPTPTPSPEPTQLPEGCAPRLAAVDASGSVQRVASAGTLAASVGSGELRIFDIATPAQMALLSELEVDARAPDLALVGERLFLADRGDGLRIFDLSDPANPAELGAWVANADRELMQEVQRDSVLNGDGLAVMAVAVSGDLAYVATRFRVFAVIDISDPSAPERVGLLRSDQTDGLLRLVAGDGVVYAQRAEANVTGPGGPDERFEGLTIIDVQDPAAPSIAGELAIEGTLGRPPVMAAGHLWFAATSSVVGVDVSTPATPLEVGRVDAIGSALSVARVRSRLFYAGGVPDSVLYEVDLGDPSAPRLAEGGTIPQRNAAPSFAAATEAGHLLLSRGSRGLDLFDVGGCE